MKFLLKLPAWIFVIVIVILLSPFGISGVIIRMIFGAIKYGWDWTDMIVYEAMENAQKTRKGDQ